MQLLICPKNYKTDYRLLVINMDKYDIIYYDVDDDWVDVINDAGVEKSFREMKNKKLYDRVVMLRNTDTNIKEFKNLSRYTIYSYDTTITKMKYLTNSKYILKNSELKKPNIWNWYSDSLTFDIISNINKKLWNILEYTHRDGTGEKFLCYLSMMNIHIEKI